MFVKKTQIEKKTEINEHVFFSLEVSLSVCSKLPTIEATKRILGGHLNSTSPFPQN